MNGRELANQVSSNRPEIESALHVGLHRKPHWPQRHAGPGHNPAPEALYPSRTAGKSAGGARYPTPKGDSHVCSLSSTCSTISFRSKVSSPFRATRFDLRLPLKYRRVGEIGWREGTTENISRSGMLFQAEESIAPNAQLEINLVLPAEIAGLAAAEVVCRGEVVRIIDAESGKVSPVLAAKILQYHFQHGSRLSEA